METPEVNLEQPVEPLPEPVKKRRTGLYIAIVLLVLLAAGAAFTAGRLLNHQPLLPGGSGLVVGGPGGNKVMMKMGDIKNAKELPPGKPDVMGVYVRREDNSIFLGTGRITMMIMKGKDGGKPDQSASYDGPVVEVLTTHDTKIYKDVTEMNLGVSEEIQQVVEPGTLDDLHSNGTVQVWGHKEGDRMIAEVLVIR